MLDETMIFIYNGPKSIEGTIFMRISKVHMYSDEEIKQELERLILEYGEINTKIIDAYATFSKDTLKRYYGGIIKALEHFNLPRSDFHRNVSKEELDKEIFRIQREFGYVSKPLLEKHGKYGPKVVNRIYGNFSKMYEVLGLEQHPSGRVPTDEELIKDFLRLYNKFRYVNQELVTQESKYSTTCYKDRFGSFNKLRKKLGMKEVASGIEKSSLSAMYAINKVSQMLNEEPELEKTFPWLVNKFTGCHFRVDAYYHNNKVAVEYNGPQHYKVDGLYVKDRESLIYRKILDMNKGELLAFHGIKVLWISYKDRITEDYLKAKLFSSVG